MMRRSRSESLGNRRRRRAVGAGSLAASMLAVGVLGTSTAAYGATGSYHANRDRLLHTWAAAVGGVRLAIQAI